MPTGSEAGGRSGGRGSQLGRNAAVYSVSLLLTSALGAAQAFLLLIVAGPGPRTEAYLAAYALYLPVVTVGASLRGTVLNLVSGESESAFEARATEIVSRCVFLGLAIVGAMLALSPLLAMLMSEDLPGSVADTTIASLLLLLPAAFLHILSAALAGALGAVGLYGTSALAYAGSSVLAVVVAAGSLALLGPIGAAVGALSGTILLAGVHVHQARSAGVLVRLRLRSLVNRDQRSTVAEVFTGAALGGAVQLNLAVSLAALAAGRGAITGYSYAYFLSSLLLTLSSLPLGMVSLPSLVAAAKTSGRASVGQQLVKLAPFAYAVVVPLMAAFVFLGRPLVIAVFEPFAGARVGELVFQIGQPLVLMTLPATLFHLASAASLPLASPQGRLLAGGATVVVHAVAVNVVPPEAVTVAWAHAAAMTVSAAVLLGQVLRTRAPRVAAQAARGAVAPLLAAGGFAAAGLLDADATLAGAVASGAAAAGLYLVLLHRLAPAVTAPFVALLRPSP